jgi:hypothetical protein
LQAKRHILSRETWLMGDAHRVIDLASLRAVLALHRGTQVNLALPGYTDADKQSLENRLNTLVSACGCNASAALLVITVLVCGILDVVFWSAFAAHPVKALGLNFAACLAGLCVGKAWGLFHARRQLVRLVRRAERLLNGNTCGITSWHSQSREANHVDLHRRLQPDHPAMHPNTGPGL